MCNMRITYVVLFIALKKALFDLNFNNKSDDALHFPYPP